MNTDSETYIADSPRVIQECKHRKRLPLKLPFTSNLIHYFSQLQSKRKLFSNSCPSIRVLYCAKLVLIEAVKVGRKKRKLL